MKDKLALTVYIFMFIVYLPKVIKYLGEARDYFKRKQTSENLMLKKRPRLKRYAPIISISLSFAGILLVFGLAYWVFEKYITAEVSNLIIKYKRPLFKGVCMTISISSLAILFGTTIGCFFAFIISSKKQLNIFKPFTNSIIYIILSIPALVLILLLSYCGYNLSTFSVSVIALSINLSPFVAKIVGGSLQNIPQDQINAAKSFGFSQWNIFKRFTTSFVIRHSLQPLLVEFYTTIKLSSLVGYIGLVEAFHTTQDIIKDTQDPMRGYIILTLCYIVLVIPIAYLADYLEKRLHRKQNQK